MAVLYVTEPGTQVHKSSERLVLVKDQQVLDEIPLIKVDQVVLMGRGVGLTTAALYALADRGVDVVYLTGKGRYVAGTRGKEHKNVRLRYTQALQTANPEFVLKAVRAIVSGKVQNQRTLVQRHAEGGGWAGRSLQGMDAMYRRVESSQTVDELRGLEGQAAKEYFNLYRQLLMPPEGGRRPLAGGSGWGFERREYYPPPDPINALLSFGYTLLLRDMEAACQMVGLDPYLGCFHTVDYGRPSMALDLIEEFRPIIVDSIVLRAVNTGAITLAHFQPGGQRDEDQEEEDKASGSSRKAVWLNDEGRTRFIRFYEQRVNEQILHPVTRDHQSYRRIFSLQAQQMARLVLGEGEDYRPLIVK